MTGWAVRLLRRYLDRNGLDHYQVWYCGDLDIEEAEWHLPALGEPDVAWQSLGAANAIAGPLTALTHEQTAATYWNTGVLHLRRHGVVLARWYWVDEQDNFRALWLAASATTAAYLSLRNEVRQQRRQSAARKWEIIRNPWGNPQWLPRDGNASGSTLLLQDELRRRIEIEVIGFFAAEVAALYRSLDVPYRRGVLLHGPPGNGKTSLIRFVGAALPQVPMLILRPGENFDTDDLDKVLSRWKTQAPAVLVIEDLDWLLKAVNVSAFLNALDGVDQPTDGDAPAASGLLLIATTNHPENLDPAINNRPGRFDVVIEMSPPAQPLRRQFFAARLAEASPQLLDWLAGNTDGLSFAHLQEILRASGLAAIHAGHPARTDADLQSAVAAVREANYTAERGFPVKLEVPFGLVRRPVAKPSN